MLKTFVCYIEGMESRFLRKNAETHLADILGSWVLQPFAFHISCFRWLSRDSHITIQITCVLFEQKNQITRYAREWYERDLKWAARNAASGKCCGAEADFMISFT